MGKLLVLAIIWVMASWPVPATSRSIGFRRPMIKPAAPSVPPTEPTDIQDPSSEDDSGCFIGPILGSPARCDGLKEALHEQLDLQEKRIGTLKKHLANCVVLGDSSSSEESETASRPQDIITAVKINKCSGMDKELALHPIQQRKIKNMEQKLDTCRRPTSSPIGDSTENATETDGSAIDSDENDYEIEEDVPDFDENDYEIEEDVPDFDENDYEIEEDVPDFDENDHECEEDVPDSGDNVEKHENEVVVRKQTRSGQESKSLEKLLVISILYTVWNLF